MRFMEWDHTGYYHPTLLQHVPDGAQRALDVGCGTGLFARSLAQRVAHVHAIDISDDVLALAIERSTGVPNVRYRKSDLLAGELEPRAYDFVSCLMCVHHMPFEPAVERLVSALRPGGVLAILGLGRLELRGLPSAAAIVPIDMAMGLRYKAAKALGRPSLAAPGGGPEFPVRDPGMSWREIKRSAAATLPGSTYKRHLFYRYSLIYRAP